MISKPALLLYAASLSFCLSGGTDAVYNGGTLHSVTISYKREVPENLKQYHQLLAKLVYSEAGHEPFDGKRAVADVVMNIANFKGINIRQAIYLPGIFDATRTYSFYLDPTNKCFEAARLALLGEHILPAGVLFFHNPIAATDTAWVQYISKFKYKQIGHHVFCWEPRTYRRLKKSWE